MREHLRIDTVKVFEDQDKILEAIKKKYGCNKSEAYRKALEIWLEVQPVLEENTTLKDDIQEMKDKLDDIYNKINFLVK